jgi:NADH-quinone oxidoreductase subunit B
VQPIIVPNTQWMSADPAAYNGGKPPTITHLAELELQDKGDNGRWGMLDVVPTTADYLLDYLRMNSLWPLLSGLACCAMEMMSAATSVNDMDRFNMFPFRASPRQADVLIVAGTLTTKMAGPLIRLWEQMPEPKWCVAMGDCTCSGGRYKRSYATVQGIDRPGRRLRGPRASVTSRSCSSDDRCDHLSPWSACGHPRPDDEPSSGRETLPGAGSAGLSSRPRHRRCLPDRARGPYCLGGNRVVP